MLTLFYQQKQSLKDVLLKKSFKNFANSVQLASFVKKCSSTGTHPVNISKVLTAFLQNPSRRQLLCQETVKYIDISWILDVKFLCCLWMCFVLFQRLLLGPVIVNGFYMFWSKLNTKTKEKVLLNICEFCWRMVSYNDGQIRRNCTDFFGKSHSETFWKSFYVCVCYNLNYQTHNFDLHNRRFPQKNLENI